MELIYSPMLQALSQARTAGSLGEVPIGAVVVVNGRTIGKGHNLTERLHDPTAHAEMIAITSAMRAIGGKYLDQCALYVTLEPCPMCAGAIRWARVGSLHYAASDPKGGYTRHTPSLLHPATDVHAGERAAESLALLRDFFRAKR